MKTKLLLSCWLGMSLSTFPFSSKADGMEGGAAPDGYLPGSSVFFIRVDTDGKIAFKDTRSPLISLPDEPGATDARSGALREAWLAYYQALLNGDETIIARYAPEGGVVPEYPPRAEKGTADLKIVTSATKNGSTRVILRWDLRTGNDVATFHDCHVWTEAKPGEWKVKSVLKGE